MRLEVLCSCNSSRRCWQPPSCPPALLCGASWAGLSCLATAPPDLHQTCWCQPHPCSGPCVRRPVLRSPLPTQPCAAATCAAPRAASQQCYSTSSVTAGWRRTAGQGGGQQTPARDWLAPCRGQRCASARPRRGRRRRRRRARAWARQGAGGSVGDEAVCKPACLGEAALRGGAKQAVPVVGDLDAAAAEGGGKVPGVARVTCAAGARQPRTQRGEGAAARAHGWLRPWPACQLPARCAGAAVSAGAAARGGEGSARAASPGRKQSRAAAAAPAQRAPRAAGRGCPAARRCGAPPRTL